MSPLELCEDEDFRGRAIWLEGLGTVSGGDRDAWVKFLRDYATAARTKADVQRTVFVVVLEGTPPPDGPQSDVTLRCLEWKGFIDETDLFRAAHDSLLGRVDGVVKRSLLAATVAHVASWDPVVAEQLLDEGTDVILNPQPFLAAFAKRVGWEKDTEAHWGLGTASSTGVVHAGLAALADAPRRELRHRLWSAQAAVFLPAMGRWRRNFVAEHWMGRPRIVEVDREDNRVKVCVEDLQIGELARAAQDVGLSAGDRGDTQKMKHRRNKLAHFEPLAPAGAEDLAECLEPERVPD